jgi:hypothetical protein
MDLSDQVLAARARRAYELGRLRVAMSVALLVVPVITLAIVISNERAECACLGLGLLLAAIGLRWYGKGYEGAAVLGLAAGVVPMIAGLGRTWFGGSPELACALLCTLGFGSGAVLVRRFRFVGRRDATRWVATLVVAAMTTLLGCLGAPKEALLGLAVGAGSAGVWVLAKRGERSGR